MKGHKKHANLVKPSLGEHGRIEIGLIGAPCSIIKKFVTDLTGSITQKITYIDADHQASESSGYSNLTDKINYDQLDFHQPLNDYDRKLLMQGADLLLVNGNHFQSSAQIVFCTEKKRESLSRKLDRLTDVKMIILEEGIDEPFEFLKGVREAQLNIPVFKALDQEEIRKAILEFYVSKISIVKGLVLAGGKSLRMGENKALLDYHGMSQVDYACGQMNTCVVETHISCRPDQDEYSDQYAKVYDTFSGIGPFGAILSAFRLDPNSAWLVMACDQPLLKEEHLQRLIDERDPSKIATCYFNPDTGFPEPLITLWEPKAYPRLLSFLSLGYSCPRKVLINSDVHVIEVGNNDFMSNANTPEERESLAKKLRAQ